jgi:peptidoglycan hydrolase CwlO-like protein
VANTEKAIAKLEAKIEVLQERIESADLDDPDSQDKIEEWESQIENLEAEIEDLMSRQDDGDWDD